MTTDPLEDAFRYFQAHNQTLWADQDSRLDQPYQRIVRSPNGLDVQTFLFDSC
ncbi:MAG: hypothetical protein JWO67_1310 [Streptosporangiaceae bacterium]|nr:hypothetical protein [Streptosporangiaceae bacterium]